MLFPLIDIEASDQMCARLSLVDPLCGTHQIALVGVIVPDPFVEIECVGLVALKHVALSVEAPEPSGPVALFIVGLDVKDGGDPVHPAIYQVVVGDRRLGEPDLIQERIVGLQLLEEPQLLLI